MQMAGHREATTDQWLPDRALLDDQTLHQPSLGLAACSACIDAQEMRTKGSQGGRRVQGIATDRLDRNKRTSHIGYRRRQRFVAAQTIALSCQAFPGEGPTRIDLI